MWDKLKHKFKGVTRPQMSDQFLEELAVHLAAQMRGSGDIDPPFMGQGQTLRDAAVHYVPIARAVSLISVVLSSLVTGGGLTVRTHDGKLVNGRRTDSILRMLATSPDGGITSSYSFMEDIASDYLLDGNALMVPDRMSGGLMGVRRFIPNDAYANNLGGTIIYVMREAYNPTASFEEFSAVDVMHMRWPILRSAYLGSSNRDRFAASPVSLMSQAINIGLSQDQYIQWWYKNAPKSGIHFDITTVDGKQTMSSDQINTFAESVRAAVSAGKAVITQGVKSNKIETALQDNSTNELRGFQVEEVARFYGIPLPLMSVAIGQWSRGINEQLMKLTWRTCFKPHLDRLLSALNLGLLKPGERFIPDPAEIIRGDSGSIAELVNAIQGDAQKNPLASREEIRHFVGLPKAAEGDIVETRGKNDGTSE